MYPFRLNAEKATKTKLKFFVSVVYRMTFPKINGACVSWQLNRIENMKLNAVKPIDKQFIS